MLLPSRNRALAVPEEATAVSRSPAHSGNCVATRAPTRSTSISISSSWSRVRVMIQSTTRVNRGPPI